MNQHVPQIWKLLKQAIFDTMAELVPLSSRADG